MVGFPDQAICLGLEEPEAGTHPYLQASRLELLRALTVGNLTESPVHVVATTHSVDLLRWVRREEALQVLRFVEHLGPDRGTAVHQLVEQQDIDKVYDAYEQNPGLAWYSGVFGGVPEMPESDCV